MGQRRCGASGGTGRRRRSSGHGSRCSRRRRWSGGRLSASARAGAWSSLPTLFSGAARLMRCGVQAAPARNVQVPVAGELEETAVAPVSYTVCTFGQLLRIVTGRCSAFHCMGSSMVVDLDTAVRRAKGRQRCCDRHSLLFAVSLPGIEDIEQ